MVINVENEWNDYVNCEIARVNPLMLKHVTFPCNMYMLSTGQEASMGKNCAKVSSKTDGAVIFPYRPT